MRKSRLFREKRFMLNCLGTNFYGMSSLYDFGLTCL